ncbi:XrtA system polysaccharide deacetylase [Candidatus Omnitrophota bacterium]
MKNILSFDVEEYFHVENLRDNIARSQWETMHSRLHVGMDTILKILQDHRVKVTFFVLGWMAEHEPELVKKIADEGHEIGSHSYEHKLIYNMTPEEFKTDLVRSIEIIESITGKTVDCFRAPCFSITKRNLWALDILLECGIKYDSSIFPIVHDRYGIHDADRLPNIILARDGKVLKEFPISTLEIFGRHIPFSGGGYFRLLPTRVIAGMARALNKQGYPLIIYLHPWEFDPGQPKVKSSWLNSFRHYVNLKTTEHKLRRLLEQIDVGPLKGFAIQEDGQYLNLYKASEIRTHKKHLSVVIPLYNEVESVEELVKQVDGEVARLSSSYEILLIDDGSKDGTPEKVKQLKEMYPSIKLIRFKRNFGQTLAMVAGFNKAEGEIIITLDGDLQNDPRDIFKLLDKIHEGYDVVSGWRYYRKDKWLTRCLPSMIANWLISRVTGVHLHDYGCSLKAYKSEVIKSMHAYGDMHRFFPAVASLAGAKTAEVIVHHRPRQFGISKYGLERTLKVMADILTIHLITKFSTKPMRYFGAISVISFLLALLVFLTSIVPCLLSFNYPSLVPVGVGLMLLLLSLHFLVLGLLCNLVVASGEFKPMELSFETAQVF